MRNNRSDGSILSNSLNRNTPSNLGLLRPNSRIHLNTITQTENLPYNNGPPIRSIRGRVENYNSNNHHSSTLNLQSTNRRVINSALREIQSEQISFQQPSTGNEGQQENFLQHVNDKLQRNNIQQRSQSLQKIKNNMRENPGESPLKKITNFNNNQLQNGITNKSYSSITNQINNYALQRINYKDTLDVLKLNNPSQGYQHIPKLQDVRDSNSNIKFSSLAQNATQINQSTHIGMNNNMINCNQIEFKYNIDQSKRSNRSYGIIKAYAANTNMGIFRNYNEDRVSIILSISKPFNKNVDYWPKTSFFAIYDGHGGCNCSDFLRDNLHLFIVRDEFFPSNPTEAIKRGIQVAEQSFLNTAESNMDRSGSCAIIVMILDDIAYTVNIGDSRAIISLRNGQSIENLSVDHKPEDERQRIEAAGGKVYQATVNTQNLMFQGVKINPPHRVFPGKLSVSRTIGDYEAKSQKYGGNPKVIISDPDIVVTKITQEHDFILLGCDGVFDRLNTQEAGKIFWNSAERSDLSDSSGEIDIHKQCGLGIEAVMRETFERKSLDNITLVAISFDGFANEFTKIQEKKQKEITNSSNGLIQQTQLLSMPSVNQNQISNTYLQQSTSSRGKLKTNQRSITNNLQNPNLQLQTYLFPKVSPTNLMQNPTTYNSDATNPNTINNEQQQQLVSPQKQKLNTLQNEVNYLPYPNGYLSTQNYQNQQILQNNYNNNQIYNNKIIQQNYNNNNNQGNAATQNNQNDQNNFYNEITPLQENRNSQANLQSNSLNTRGTYNKQDFENTYFHKKNRLSTPSTIRKYSNLYTSTSNTSNTQLQIENSRLAIQSNQSLQTLKALQNEKIFQQLQQIQQQQKIIQAKKR